MTLGTAARDRIESSTSPTSFDDPAADIAGPGSGSIDVDSAIQVGRPTDLDVGDLLGPDLPRAVTGEVFALHDRQPLSTGEAAHIGSFTPFELLQQWEGTVLEQSQGEFRALLRDITDPSRPTEEATFDRKEVSPDDEDLLAIGAVFRWSIGYRTQQGSRERVSQITFVRLPAWSSRAIREIREGAAALRREFSE